jgi:predicted RNase H-like HicB family nuclease
LITEAETVEEAFRNAYDAAKSLKQSRRKLIRKLQSAGAA